DGGCFGRRRTMMSTFWKSLAAIALGLGLAVCFGAPACALAADDFERPPIEYSKAAPENAVARLLAEIESGAAPLKFGAKQGYLPALLEYLDIPIESQVLVFSKTSLQRNKISPQTPRAIYFNDDIYVGFCQNGDVLEISVADPKLGAVFYTIDQTAPDR